MVIICVDDAGHGKPPAVEIARFAAGELTDDWHGFPAATNFLKRFPQILTRHSEVVVILDEEMPKLRGSDLLPRIREKHPATFIVANSSSWNDILLAAGADTTYSEFLRWRRVYLDGPRDRAPWASLCERFRPGSPR